MRVIDEGPKPQTAQEAVLYAYGQLYVLKSSIGATYISEDKTDLAISTLLLDKVGSTYQKVVMASMAALQNGTSSFDAELGQFTGPVESFDNLPDTENILAMKRFIKQAEDGITTTAAAITVTSDIKDCVVRVSPDLSFPCESKADYLLILLLKYKQMKQPSAS
jgi:hypothetical protein